MRRSKYQTVPDLLAVLEGSLINVDVLQQVIDVSRLPLEFTDRCGTASHDNEYTEWTQDRLQAVDTTNALIDGQDMTGNDHVLGQRVGNHSQISGKIVQTSSRADSSDTIGRANELAYAVNRRGQEVMRDCEAIAMLNQASLADTGAAAGKTGGLEAWIDGKILVPTATGAAAGSATQTAAFQDLSTGGVTGGGWDNRTSPGTVLPAWDYSAVTAVNALTETAFHAVLRALYENTGSRKNRVAMSRPVLHEKLSAWFFNANARVATLQDDRAGPNGPAQAQTAVNSILTDWGIVDMVPNALQPVSGDGSPDSDTLFILDFDTLDISHLRGFQVEELGKTGLSEKRQLTKDWTLKPVATENQGMIVGIDSSAAMTA